MKCELTFLRLRLFIVAKLSQPSGDLHIICIIIEISYDLFMNALLIIKHSFLVKIESNAYLKMN